VVIDLQRERQFQSRGKAADEIDSDPLDLALTLPDRKEGGCRRSRNDAAAKFSGGCELFEIGRIGHDAQRLTCDEGTGYDAASIARPIVLVGEGRLGRALDDDKSIIGALMARIASGGEFVIAGCECP